MSRKHAGPQIVVKVISAEELAQSKYLLAGKIATPIAVEDNVIKAIGGPISDKVYVVTEEEVNSGKYRIAGGSAQKVIDSGLFSSSKKVVGGKYVTPVYIVSGSFAEEQPVFVFDPLLTTFTPAMAKRTGQAAFAGAPIAQGVLDDDTRDGDQIDTVNLGTLIANDFYPYLDVNQGSVVFWLTPEWDGDDGQIHDVFGIGPDAFSIYKNDSDRLYFRLHAGMYTSIDITAWTAGTTYCLVGRWDAVNTLDGTNYVSISVNDVHTFGGIKLPVVTPENGLRIGVEYFNDTRNADAIIEGLTIYRRPLFDGTYGFDKNGDGVDEINAIYAAGAGADPTQITGASWDIVFCMPTDSTPGELVSGTGEAWSHPHSSAILEETFMADGGYMGEPYAVEFNGTNTQIDCGSDASLDDLPAGANFQVEGWFKWDNPSAGQKGLGGKGANGARGWYLVLQSDDTLRASVRYDGVPTFTPVTATCRDGKWHHFCVDHVHATITTRVALDGVWTTGSSGAGNYISDAADDMSFGGGGVSLGVHIGIQGWVRLSDVQRYTPGTDFIPPVLMPAADGNTVEQWALDDGSGATVAATVAGANDGTLSNGTWVEQWDYQGTVPLKPTSIEFDGSATTILCGSDASLDDLHDDEFTTELWIRYSNVSGVREIISKDTRINGGWAVYINTDGTLRFVVNCADTDSLCFPSDVVYDDRWHHIACHFNDAGGADRKAHIAIDGVWKNAGVLAVGVIQSDAGNELKLGRNTMPAQSQLGWVRISNNDRYDAATPTNFTPPSRIDPPADDGNTVSLWNMEEGAGTTVADSNANANHGTLTPGTGGWITTHELAVDAPGEQRFGVGGYVFGVDAANEGIKQSHVGLAAGQDYVLRLLAHLDPSSPTDDLRIRIWDDTNDAQIGADFDIGQGSSWDEPIEAIFTWELPTIARNGVGADCVAMSVMILGTAAGQAINVHQCEVQENLIDNPSLETGAGNPWIPDGWNNDALDAGDSAAEAVIVHSGVGSVRFSTGAVNWEGIRPNPGYNHTVGKFIGLGGWVYGDGGTNSPKVYVASSRMVRHNVLSEDINLIGTGVASWKHVGAVGRVISANATYLYWLAISGAVANRYLDDSYMFVLDDVSLTVTPASEANSTENGGLRVDGYDTLTQPITDWFPRAGKVAFNWTPRHSDSIFESYGNTQAMLAFFEFGGNDWIRVRTNGASTLQLSIMVGGVFTFSAPSWDATGLIDVGSTYLVEVEYDATQITFSVDGVVMLTLTPAAGIDFGANIPNVAYWGVDNTGAKQFDAVFSAP